MQQLNFNEALEEILTGDKRYEAEAYQFVREGLDYTLKLLKKRGRNAVRHVRGQELLEGLRRFAVEQYGPLAKTVLDYWGVRCCEDFGEIVFNMVDKGILGRSEEDTRADFKGGYDFDEAFLKPFVPTVRTAGRRVAERTHTQPPRSAHDQCGTNTKKLSGGPN